MLVFAGLWTASGKNGVFKWKPRSLKLDILPFLKFDIINTLAILERHGFIIHFKKDGEEYGYIPTFLDHQCISHKEKEASAPCPDYSESYLIPIQTPTNTDPEPTRNGSGTNPDTADIGHMTQDTGHRTMDMEPQAATPKSLATIPQNNQLYNSIKTAFEKVNGDFTDYAKEGAAIKRIIKLTKGDESAIQIMIKTFFTLRQRNDRYWSVMPFTPSRLAASGVWDGVKEEAKKTLAATDTAWIDEMEKEEAMV